MSRRIPNRRRSLLLVIGVALLVASAPDTLNFVKAQDAVESAEGGHEDEHEHEHEQMVLIDPAPSAKEAIGHDMDGDGMVMEHADDEDADDDEHTDDGDHPNEMMKEEDHHTDDEDDHDSNGGPSHLVPEMHEAHADEHHAAADDPTDENVVNATSEEASIAQMVHIHEADVYTQSGYDTEAGSDPICWIAPNHLLSDSVSQMTVQSEAFDGHGGHDHLRRWRSRRVSTKAVIDRNGSSRSSVRGTKYIVDTKGNVKVVPIVIMPRPKYPSLKEGLPPGRRSVTITTDLEVTSPNRREQQLPSWMTQDFVGEMSELESHEHEKGVGEGADHPEKEGDAEVEHGSEEVNIVVNDAPDDHHDGHMAKMDEFPHIETNVTKQDGMHVEHSDEDGGHYGTDSHQGMDDHNEAHEIGEAEGDLIESHLSHNDDHSDVDHDDEAHHGTHSLDEDYAHASHDEEHHDEEHEDEISLESAIQAATTLTGSFIKSVVPAHSSDDQDYTDLVESNEDESHHDDHHSDHSEEDGEVHLLDDLAPHPSHDDGLAEDDHPNHGAGSIEEIHPSHDNESGMDDAVIGEIDKHSDDNQDASQHSDEHEEHDATAHPEEDEVEHADDIHESEMDDADGEDDRSEEHLHSQEDPITEEDAGHDMTTHIGGGLYNADGSFAGRKWSSELVPDFIAGHTSTLPRCPHGLTIHVDGPDEMEQGEVLRTGQNYKFRLRGEIWLDDIREEYGLDASSHLYSSDGGKAKVAVQILFCPIGKHCTPFIFDGHAEDGEEGDHDSHDHRYLQGEPHDHSEDEKHSDDETVTGTSSHASHASHDSHEDGMGEHALHIEISHDSHDGDGRIQHQHIQSETLLLEFDDPDQDLFLIDFEKEVTVDFPGEFVPLGHIQFFVTDGINGASASPENVAFKIDSANTLHQGVVRFQAPSTIKKVGRGSEIFSYLMIFLVGSLELFLLVSTIRDRNHSVIRLSQGIFLVVCLFSALVASTASFLFNPKSDIYCRTYGPVVMIPLQVMLAVIIGRLHRIIAVMTPLMEWQQSQYNNRGRKKSKRVKKIGKMLPSWTGNDTRGSRTSQSSASSSSLSSDSSDSDSGGRGIAQRARRFRKKKFQHRTLKVEFSERKLWLYVALISSPQIIVQIIGLALYPQSIVVLFNTDKSIGRQQCFNSDAPNYHYAEYAVLFITVLYLLIQSQRTKRLPSLFDEGESISAAIVSCVVVTVIGIAVIAVSNEPTSSADVSYLMMVAIVLVLTVNMSYRLIMPKLRLIWRGENVAVNQILAKHKEESMKMKPSQAGSASSLRPQMSNEYSLDHSSANNLSAPKGILRSQLSEASVASDGEARKVTKMSRVSFHEDPVAMLAASLVKAPEQSPKEKSNGTHTQSRNVDVLQVGQPTPKSLMVACVDHAECVDRINRRLLSGLQVSAEEWEELRSSVQKMQQYFKDECRFGWEGEA